MLNKSRNGGCEETPVFIVVEGFLRLNKNLFFSIDDGCSLA